MKQQARKTVVPSRPPFSMALYEQRRGEVLLHMSHFFLRYLNLLYQAFDGDLALVIVLGEISHHNTAKFFSPHDLTNQAIQDLQKNPALRNEMAGCNTFSMSAATGIPRETVRRKVAELERRGWIENVPKKGLRITPACSEHFAPDFSIKILSELLKAARFIEHLLAERGIKAVRRSKNPRLESLPDSQAPAPLQPSKPKRSKRKKH